MGPLGHCFVHLFRLNRGSLINFDATALKVERRRWSKRDASLGVQAAVRGGILVTDELKQSTCRTICSGSPVSRSEIHAPRDAPAEHQILVSTS